MINIDAFNELCNECCSSTNQQKKQQAEKQIYSFIEDIRNFDVLSSMISSTQQPITIFVICEYLVKIILSERSFQGYDMTKQDGTRVMAMIEGQSYNQEELVKIREKTYMFEKLTLQLTDQLVNSSLTSAAFVQNSICNLVGLVVQQLLSLGTDKESLIQCVLVKFFNCTNEGWLRIGLKLIKNMLVNIQSYNAYDSYISYRRVMLGFQSNGVSQMFSAIASVLQQQQAGLTKQLIESLKETLLFNFNISYFELETDFDPNEQNTVNFSEGFAQYLSDKSLLRILFDLVVRHQNNDVSVSLLSLKCLKRIASCRKRVFSEKSQRKQFARDLYEGSLYLLQKMDSQNEEVINDMLEFNSKIQINFGIRTVRADFQFCFEWLESLKNFSIMILQLKKIKINDLYIKALLELWKKIGRYLFDYKISQILQLKNSISVITSEIGKSIMSTILVSSNSFFQGYTPQTFKKFRHALRDFFEGLFPLLQIDIITHLTLIHQNFVSLFNQFISGTINNQQFDEKFVIQLSLINYIVINTAILEKNVSREELPVESRNMVILIIKSLLEFIQFLTSQPTTIVSSLVHMTTMNIAENLLQYSLSEIDEGIGKLRNQKVFFQTFILPLQIQANQSSNITTHTLILYIQKVLSIENKELLLYALNIIKETIIRLKHHLLNDVFSQLYLISQIQSVLLNLHSSALQKPDFYCCRTNSAEILSLLMLDNAYENYVKNILELDSKLKLQPTFESIMIYLYEIQGYFRHVDVAKIFRLMLKQQIPSMQDLFTFILVNNPNQFDLCKLCLKVIATICENKIKRALRFQYFSQSIVVVQCIRMVQVVTHKYCLHIQQAIKDEKVKNNNSSQMLVIYIIIISCRIIGLIFRIIYSTLKGKYISQSCQLLFSDRSYLDLILIAIDIALETAPLIIMYSKSCLQVVQVLQIVTNTQIQLFEAAPFAINNMLKIVQIIQFQLLTTLFEVYRQHGNTSPSGGDKLNLGMTKDIITNILEYINEEKQLASNKLSTVTHSMDEIYLIIENILNDVLTCILKGHCAPQTNNLLISELFAIICTHQQLFNKVLMQIVFSSKKQYADESLNQFLYQDLEFKIDPENTEIFRKNLNSFLKKLDF